MPKRLRMHPYLMIHPQSHKRQLIRVHVVPNFMADLLPSVSLKMYLRSSQPVGKVKFK
jgi:hypothetical protein